MNTNAEDARGLGSTIGEHRRPNRARRLVGIALAVVALGGIVYATLWFVAAERFHGAALNHIEELRREGYDIRFADVSVGGFPAAVTLDFVRPLVGRKFANIAWTWRGATMRVQSRPLDGHLAAVQLPNESVVTAIRGASTQEFAVKAASLAAAVIPSTNGPTVRLTAGDLQVTSAEGEEVTASTFQLVRQPTVAGNGGDRPETGFDATVETLVLPTSLRLPFGRTIASIGVRGTLVGRLHGGAALPALSAWRDAGGVIEIEQLRGTYGPLSVTGGGSIAIDGQAQPIAAFTMNVRGLGEVVDALAARGIVRRQNVSVIKAVIAALGRRREPGSPPEVTVPVSIQDRVLTVGPTALSEIPYIQWPDTF